MHQASEIEELTLKNQQLIGKIEAMENEMNSQQINQGEKLEHYMS